MKSSSGAFGAFVLSYALLPFGLLLPLFQMKISVFGMVVSDEALSTFGTIRKLWTGEHRLPAQLILLFSVLVPLFKLGLLLFELAGHRIANAQLLRRSARWATVDAFVAMLLSIVFAGSSSVDVALKLGFYFFLSYCLLSVVASQMVPVDGESADGEARREHGGAERFMGGVCIAASAALLLLGVVYPCFEVNVSMLALDKQLTIRELLGQRDVHVLIPVLAVLVPLFEVAARILGWQGADGLADWAMGDVLAVAVLVCVLVLKTLPGTTAEVRIGGWFLLAHAGFAMAARTLLTRPAKHEYASLPIKEI